MTNNPMKNRARAPALKIRLQQCLLNSALARKMITGIYARLPALAAARSFGRIAIPVCVLTVRIKRSTRWMMLTAINTSLIQKKEHICLLILNH